jgi:hypothetical protein
MTERRNDLGWVLAALRMAVGAAVWAAPGVPSRVLGERAPVRSSLPFVLRLFGARDFSMGLGYLQATPAQQDQLLRVGMGVDAADAAAAVLAHRRGHLPGYLAAPFALTAVAAVVAAAAARRR